MNIINVLETKTDIFGLRGYPQMQNYDNDADWAPFTKACSKEVSDRDYNLVKDIAKNYMTHGVMEIGVSRNGPGSFTYAMLVNKPDNIPYLGVDLDDKSYLNDVTKNIYTIRENSFNQDTIRDYITKIGIEKISVLFIDGWHSLNAVINDWKYADLLSDNGIVIFHDTNYHPGPLVFLDYIDKTKFRVEKYFQGEDDYGVGIAYRI